MWPAKVFLWPGEQLSVEVSGGDSGGFGPSTLWYIRSWGGKSTNPLILQAGNISSEYHHVLPIQNEMMA